MAQHQEIWWDLSQECFYFFRHGRLGEVTASLEGIISSTEA